MRFVEFGPHPGGAGLRLHPRITFLRGLDPVARVGIVGMVHDLALGEVPDRDGVVEIDGAELPFAEAVELVGVTADSGLILPAESLPEPVVVDEGDRAALEQEVVEAEARVAELTEMIVGLADELASGESVRADMKASVTSATARVEGDAAAILDRADAELVRAARVEDRPDPWTGMQDVEERVAHLRALLAELDEHEQALPAGDREALAVASATARLARSDAEGPNPEAAGLAQAWSVLHEQLAMLEARLQAEDRSPDGPAARLDAARAAARAAEAATVPRNVTDEETEQLEQLHEAMLDAEARASRGMRKGAGRAGFEKARAALQDALEPLGYPTWTAFRMGGGKVAVSAEVLEAFEAAKSELAAAEEEWERVAARLDEDVEFQDVLERIDAVLTRATELIGPGRLDHTEEPAAVTAALGALVVPRSECEMSEAEAVDELRRALTEAGAPGHQDVGSDAGLILLGSSWLQVLADADTARVRIARDRERAEAELAALEGLEGSRVDRLDDERAAVREAEEAVAATRDALCDVVRARLQLHVLAVTELSLAQQHDDLVTELEEAEAVLGDACRRLQGVSGRDPSGLAERVPRGLGGPIPIVVVMGDLPASRLDVVRDLPDDVQIVVIGEGSGIDEWVAAAGPDVAAVVEASTFV